MNFPAARGALLPPSTDKTRPDLASHAGLLWSRGLRTLRNRAPDADKEEANNARADLLDRIKIAVVNSNAAYEPAFMRYQKALWALPHTQTFEATVGKNQRLLIGMGTATPLEVGLTLHHTYGVPYIPGSALKGLVAHYTSEVWGRLASEDQARDAWKEGGVHHSFVFGTQKKAGAFAFMDTWIYPDSVKHNPLADDVVTPHHREYYGFKPDPKKPDKPIPPPADWDSPVPVAFLSVRDNIKFFGGIHSTITPITTVEINDLKQWFPVVHELLKCALHDWGIGGKTSAGYGQMHQYRGS